MYDVFAWADNPLMRGQNLFIIITLVLFIYVIFSRILRYERIVRNRMLAVVSLAIFIMFFYITFDQAPSSLIIIARDHVDRSLTGSGLLTFNIINSLIVLVPLTIISYVLIQLAIATWKHIPITNIILLLCFLLIWVVAVYMLKNEFAKTDSEISVAWFSVLNPFFVITLASSVSKIWESKFNPPAALKYGFGLFFVAIGYLAIWLGSVDLGEGAKISVVFLILTYLFHTLGELFISPVGLSYVSKLVPARMLAFMFGMWYLGIAIAQKIAATLGGQITYVKENYGLDAFFLIFAVIATVAGVLVILLHPMIKRLMHGIK